MSLYSLKQGAGGAVQPWSQVITLAEAGHGCDGLFGLYDSLGDKTLVGAHTIATLLDGPEKVVRYGALTLGDGATATSLTASQRCKGLTILCDSLTVKANATLHMTGKGPRIITNDDPFFPFIDYKIPFKISLDSSRMSLAQALAVIKSLGLAPWDIGEFQHAIANLFGFNLSIPLAGSMALMLASGCGGRPAGQYNTSYVTGIPGLAGSNGAPGSGANGGVGNGSPQRGGKGTPYGGGAGSGGVFHQSAPYMYSLWETWTAEVLHIRYSEAGGRALSDTVYSLGGGAGNLGGAALGTGVVGGDGVGGKLTIICRGAITVQSGGKIEANGMPGGAGATCGGGGSGGGHISIISPSAPSNAGTIQCVGGAGGSGGGASGGAGGAGSVVTKTFSDMGW